MEQRRQSLGALPRDLDIDVQLVGDRHVVRLDGDLDLHTAPALREALAATTGQESTWVVVDLEQVTVIDSVAIGVLVAALKRLRGEASVLELVCRNERILRLFRITRLDGAFRIHPDLASALA